MQPFNHAIGSGMIGCCVHVPDTQYLGEGCEEGALELPAAVGCNGRRTAETRDPDGDEGVSDCFRCDVGERNGLWPSCKSVHTCEYVSKSV